MKPNISHNLVENWTAETVAAIFADFDKLNVLIVGDVMIDRYQHGKVNRISPEAPVPVVDLTHAEDRLGGAANVALNIRALGATPYLFSVIGKDVESTHFLKLMNQNDLSTRGILQKSSRKTTVKTRIMAQGQQLLRLDHETTTNLTDAESKDFLKNMLDFIEYRDIHVIIFQDYNKGVLTPTVIRETLLESIRRDIPTAVDPKFKNFWEYRRSTLFKPNLKEMSAAVPFSVTATLESLDAAANYVTQNLGNRHTLITLSERGAYVNFLEPKPENGSDTGGGRFERFSDIVPTEARVIADVSGAGDTVISVASLCLALGLPMRATAMLSNAAGGQVCERSGVVPVDKTQLEADFIGKHVKKG